VGETPSTSDLQNAISSQESGGSYTAVNSQSGALGKYQIMPQDWFGLIGLNPNSKEDIQEFLNNPTQQDQLYSQIMDTLGAQYGGNTDKILAAYYGGDAAAQIVGTPAADQPQPGGMPSINQYVQQVESKLNTGGSIQSFVDNINNGIMTISQVPTQYRKKVSDALAAQGGQLSSAQQQSVQGMLNIYQTTGQIPPMGMGSPLMRMEFYQTVGSGGQSLVSGAAANKATIAGATSALKTQQTQYAANQTSLGTLDQQLQLLQTYSNKVDRSGSPILNKYELWLKGQVQGDADTQALQNIVLTASTEFAKILSGASASISGVTVSTAQDAQNLLNANMTPEQINQIISVMKTEGQYRLDNQKNSINQIQSDIKNIGQTPSPTTGGSVTSGTTPSGVSYTVSQ
jgi:hypothetical protein